MAWTSITEQLLVRCNVIKYLYFFKLDTRMYLQLHTEFSYFSTRISQFALFCGETCRHIALYSFFVFLAILAILWSRFFFTILIRIAILRWGIFEEEGFFKDLPPKRLNLQHNVLLNVLLSPYILLK